MYKLIVLKPEDLNNPAVLEGLKRGMVVLMQDSSDGRVTALTNAVMNVLKPCKCHISQEYTARNVRVYVNYLIENADANLCFMLEDRQTLLKGACLILGALITAGVYLNKPSDMARSLHGLGYKFASIRKYIYDGMGMSDMVELFEKCRMV